MPFVDDSSIPRRLIERGVFGHPPAYPEDAGARDGGANRKRALRQNPLRAGKVLAKRGSVMRLPCRRLDWWRRWKARSPGRRRLSRCGRLCCPRWWKPRRSLTGDEWW